MSVWGAIGSAAASMVGPVLNYIGQEKTNKTNLGIARETNAFNKTEAEITRDWQEDLSNSAYQRSMLDMKSAGLNPILAYQQGGANTPSAATASGVSASAQNSMSAFSDIGDKANTLLNSAKNREVADNQINQLKANVTNTVADSRKKMAETKEADTRTFSLLQDINRKQWENKLLPDNYSSAVEARQKEAEHNKRSKEVERVKTKHVTPIIKGVDQFLDSSKEFFFDNLNKAIDHYSKPKRKGASGSW